MQGIKLERLRGIIFKEQFPVDSPVGPAFFSRLLFRNPSVGQHLYIEGATVCTLQSAGAPPTVWFADGSQPMDGICDPFGGGAVNEPRAMFMPTGGPPGVYIPSGQVYLNSVDASAGEVLGIRLQLGLYMPVRDFREPGEYPDVDMNEQREEYAQMMNDLERTPADSEQEAIAFANQVSESKGA